MFLKGLKFKNYFFQKQGQSLIEIIIGLAVGALIIGGATFAIFAMLNTGVTLQKAQSASVLSQELLDEVRLIAGANWNDVYNLPTKGSSTPYYVVASGTNLLIVNGKESVFDNDVKNGLAGYWKLDEATSLIAYDSSGTGNNGMLAKDINATSTPERYQGTTNCKAGGCLKFNGLLGYYASGTLRQGNWVEVPYSDSLNIQGPAITISLWIYPLAYPLDFSHLIRLNGYDYGYRLGLISNQKLGFQLTGEKGYTLTTSSTIPLNKWSFVTAVLDPLTSTTSTMKIYINGEQDPKIKDRPGNIDPVPSDQVFYIGVAPEYYVFDGYIDEARVYNRALSAAEVKKLYSGNIFSRYFYVDDICRANDALTSIVGLPPCNGTILDPSTQKILVSTEWFGQGKIGDVRLVDYLTRWENYVFRQTDWSAGIGTSTPLKEPDRNFSTSSNIDFSNPGLIKLEGF
ncbi:MAG: LamG domain-containing protein [Patescibacteria group bacterium]|nr:LamG domain-containing protein [Patescibacteria group bacterium]